LSHVSNIHRRNVCHQDLEPRNIVMSTSGQLRVVDFELSDRFHKCIPHDCHELQGLSWETQGSLLNDVAPNRHIWLLSAIVALMVVLVYLQPVLSVN
jgi:serine/threonine protein kinase